MGPTTAPRHSLWPGKAFCFETFQRRMHWNHAAREAALLNRKRGRTQKQPCLHGLTACATGRLLRMNQCTQAACRAAGRCTPPGETRAFTLILCLPWGVSAACVCMCAQALDEIHAGACDGHTYAQIANASPEEYLARQQDKLRYRWARGQGRGQDLAR